MTSLPPKPPLPRRTPQAVPARTTGAPVPTGRAATAKIQEAVEARDALAAALTTADIQLPAMDIRTPWPDTGTDTDNGDAGQATRYALVHLGVCTAPVALALAAVIVKGAGR